MDSNGNCLSPTYLIRSLFEECFPGASAARSVVRWVPRWQAHTDSSGRANPFHANAWARAAAVPATTAG